MNNKDYYSILELPKTATEEDIKKAYRKLAMKYHPDRTKGDKAAEEKFKEMKEAYDVLSDPAKRAHYDSPQRTTFTRGGNWSETTVDSGSFDDAIREMFAHFHQRSSTRQVVHGLEISLVDAYRGRNIQLDKNTTINVPAGVRSGTMFYADNKMYKVNVRPDIKFKRTNDDLLVDINISAIEAMLGINAMLDHLDGNRLQFSIPAGIQMGQVVKLTGKGMKNPETDRFGDMLIRVSIVIPTSLTDEEISKIKSLKHNETINI